MIVKRSMNDQFLSNTYLVASGEGHEAFFVDAGGPVKPLIEEAERLQLRPSHLLLTHHHFDHVSAARELVERWPDLQVLVEPRERDLLGQDVPVTGTIEAGATLAIGGLDVKALPTPGHTAGMLSFLVSAQGGSADGGSSDGRSAGAGAASASSYEADSGGGDAGDPSGAQGLAVFTGDTLFKGSVGGVRAPGHSTYADLKSSIVDTLMKLPSDTVIHPGHTDPTTVAYEWEHNPFIRLWRGVDSEGSGSCVVFDQQATLVLLCDDYDGGKKALVRWQDGSDDIVPGSQVQTA